jgi:hypothetical protein
VAIASTIVMFAVFEMGMITVQRFSDYETISQHPPVCDTSQCFYSCQGPCQELLPPFCIIVHINH